MSGEDVPTQSLNFKAEFFCGLGAAFINISCTFPIYKVMFRQQLQGVSVYMALRQMKMEGARNLYRGFLPPLLQKTTSLSIMFGSYRQFQLHLDEAFPAVPVSCNHAAAAMLAGTLEMTLLPFERIQVLLQSRAFHNRFRNTLHAARALRAYGVREYYRGASVVFCRNGPSNVLFFLGREALNDATPHLSHVSSHVVKDLVCGAFLGAVISTLFFPLNVVKAYMQSTLGGRHVGVWPTFNVIWQERGHRLTELFRGVHLNYTRSLMSWAIINASYEQLMRLLTCHSGGS